MKEELINNIDKIHTTILGMERIKKNTGINDIEDIKIIILDNKSIVYKKGKNYYCLIDDIIITINSYNYSVITAHTKSSR